MSRDFVRERELAEQALAVAEESYQRTLGHCREQLRAR